jgi:(4S)-4-hydroxy-5-phosphonooxypentane-2,3-dione isomerase
MEDEHVILVARFETKPGFGPKVRKALLRMVDEVKKKEPGCLSYIVHNSLEHDDVFLLYETYKNKDALAAHRETPFFKDLIEGQVVPHLAVRQRELYSVCEKSDDER